MDMSLLNELSVFIDWEQEVRWTPLQTAGLEPRQISLPPAWESALRGSNSVAGRIEALWSGLESLLPRTYAVFRAKCEGLALLETKSSPLSLVYIFSSDGQITARRGYVPAATLPPISARLPVNLAPFYDIHDGLIHLMSHDGGPAPSAQWQVVAAPESGQAGLVKIAMNGADAFGFDITETPAQALAILPSDDEVMLVEDAWEYLDDLLASPLEDL
jgi:hypothetical protein